MYTVSLIGTGNVAQHLFEAFRKAEKVKVVQVYGRDPEKLKRFSMFSDTCSDFKELKPADVYIIAVNDDAIQEVAKSISQKSGIIVHTSGAMDMNCIPSENRGVFYPLQTFTEGKSMNYKDIPVCLESNNLPALELLSGLANQITSTVREIDSEQRKKLHLSAVFVNNFTNHLYHIGENICEEEGLDFSLLRPLIQETANKIQSVPPREAQTGPARRGDTKSMEGHLELLKDENQKKLYTLFSQAIAKTYEKKL